MHTMEQHQTSTVTIRNKTTEAVYDNWTIGFSTEVMTGKADPQEEIVRMIQVIGRPPIIVLGTIGNLLTFFTMQRGKNSVNHVNKHELQASNSNGV